MEGVYAPYPKWFGTAFNDLPIAVELGPIFKSVLGAEDWPVRDRFLAEAFFRVAEAYNRSGMTPDCRLEVKPFFNRPFSVIVGESGVEKALLARIENPRLQHLKSRRPIGSLEIFSDNTDLLEDHSLRLDLKRLYEESSPRS